MDTKITVFHNPRCSKSRCAIDLLRERHLEFEIIEYISSPLTADELRSIINLLGIRPQELIRKNEQDFKNYFKGQHLTDEASIEAMIKFPKLIERPIVVRGNMAVVARPTERILDIL